jgi:hypothetical protein
VVSEDSVVVEGRGREVWREEDLFDVIDSLEG